jgi:GT2 family glycosyltransferase
MDLSVITVTHQSEDHIADQILSVVVNTVAIQHEHIIVDNASTDGTVPLIETCYANYVKLIKNHYNAGFASANNLAVSQSKGRYLLFLNPDMKIHEGSLDSFIRWMDDNPSVGIAGCKLLSHSLDPHHALRPGKFPKMGLYLFSLIKFIPFFCSVHPKLFYPSFNDDQVQEVDHVRGAFMMMRKEVIDKIGFAFDPSYFILLEDIDICKEVKKLGYQVVYNPQMSCVDFFGISFQKKTQCWKYSEFCKSLIIYSRKWHPWYEHFFIKLAIPIGFLFRVSEWGWKESCEGLIKVFYENK